MQIIPIDRSSNQYPALFCGIPDEPQRIYTYGDQSLLNSKCVAIIGTREPTPGGIAAARSLAADLAELGYTIVAGLAAGIDTAAHLGALDVGGKTIAVLATTISQTDIYPKENTDLARRIGKLGGLLITEYNVKAFDRRRFVERDRLQSALCKVVIPVQCSSKSGTLHTVDAAIAQRRIIYVPEPHVSELKQFSAKYAGVMDLITSGKGIPFDIDNLDMLIGHLE